MTKRKSLKNGKSQTSLSLDFFEGPCPTQKEMEEEVKKRFPFIDKYYHSVFKRNEYKTTSNCHLGFKDYIVLKLSKYHYLVIPELQYENSKPDDYIEGIHVVVKDDLEKASEILKHHLSINVVPMSPQLILLYRVNGGIARAPISSPSSNISPVDIFFKLLENLSHSERFHEIILGSVTNINRIISEYNYLLSSNNSQTA